RHGNEPFGPGTDAGPDRGAGEVRRARSGGRDAVAPAGNDEQSAGDASTAGRPARADASADGPAWRDPAPPATIDERDIPPRSGSFRRGRRGEAARARAGAGRAAPGVAKPDGAVARAWRGTRRGLRRSGRAHGRGRTPARRRTRRPGRRRTGIGPGSAPAWRGRHAPADAAGHGWGRWWPR